jgi:LacI family transcriptional regulator
MNLEEVAKRAKVSTATVSRVLNQVGQVKGTTRTRVMKAVEELKYRPNLHARNLAGGKSRSIGLIVSNIENPFFLDIYHEIETNARGQGYEVIMANTDYSSEQLVTSIRLMIGRRVAGLAAIVSEMHPELIEELAHYQIPVVFYDVGTIRKNISNIRVNYRRGMGKLTDYLYSLGHRQLGFVGHHGLLGPITERANAVMEAMARYADVTVQTAADVDSFAGGRRATQELLSSHPEVTAIICVNDCMAIGAMREIRDLGLRIPEDVSVTGFDNVNLAQFCYPGLTSVHIPRHQVAELICDLLIPNGKTQMKQEISIDPELVVRESSGLARKR